MHAQGNVLDQPGWSGHKQPLEHTASLAEMQRWITVQMAPSGLVLLLTRGCSLLYGQTCGLLLFT